IHLLGFFRRDVLMGVEVLDGTAEAHGEVRDIHMGDGPNAALACENILPSLRHAQAYWRNDAQTSDYDTPLSQQDRILLRTAVPIPLKTGIGKAKAAITPDGRGGLGCYEKRISPCGR